MYKKILKSYTYKVFLRTLYRLLACILAKKYISLIRTTPVDIYTNLSMLYKAFKKDPTVFFVQSCTTSLYEDLYNIYILATSRIWIVDTSCRYVSQFSVSSKTQIIYIGHGGGVYKKMAFAAMPDNASSKEKQRVARVHGKYSYVICSSESACQYVATNYHLPLSRIKALGLPRTDLFYHISIKDCKDIFYYRYPSTRGKKLILYAPTFRTGANGSRYMPVFLESEKIPLHFYDDFCILFHSHPTVPPPNLSDRWIDVSGYPITELLAIADFLISDFSSIIFDYSFFRRPIFLFIPDFDLYKNKERQLWVMPELLSDMICSSTEDLLDKLNSNTNYKDDLWDKYMNACDGNSSNKIVAFIKNLKGNE